MRERFGVEVLDPDGSVDRGALAARAFATADDRSWLEGLLWPRVGARVAGWRDAELGRRPPPLALVVEVPLLFEAGLEAMYDATVAIVAPDALRAERAGARGHQALEARGARQLSPSEKAERATFAIVNDADVAALERRLSEVLATLSE